MQNIQENKPSRVVCELHTEYFHSVNCDSNLGFVILSIVPSWEYCSTIEYGCFIGPRLGDLKKEMSWVMKVVQAATDMSYVSQ